MSIETDLIKELAGAGIITDIQAGDANVYLLNKIICEDEQRLKIITQKKEVVKKIVITSSGLTWDEILSKKNTTTYCDARHIYAFACHEYLKIKSGKLGKEMRRDRTTIIHSCQRAKEMIDTNDVQIISVLSQIKTELNKLHVQ